jgi:glycosyltransferase involved in cell wall biosynthesis
MSKNHGSILVVNPVSGRGHLDSWNSMVIGSLLRAGWSIIALTQHPEKLIKDLSINSIDHSKLSFLDFETTMPKTLQGNQSALKKLQNHWNFFSLENLKSSKPNKVLGYLYLMTEILMRYVRILRRRYYCVSDSKLDLSFFHANLQTALEKNNLNPILIFNMFLDYFNINSTDISTNKISKLKWAGIRFNPSSEDLKVLGLDTSFQGLFLLDDFEVDLYAASLQDKIIRLMPDITNDSVPSELGLMVENIKNRARGRKIIFIGGVIGGQKNITSWCGLIQEMDPAEWYFVQIGEVILDSFSAKDLIAYIRLLLAIPENVFILDSYIGDESVFNELIIASDVIFAAYRNFSRSSNMLAKAAIFRKPILVSDGGLMGEKVKHYQMGIVVDMDNIGDMKTALNLMRENQGFLTGFQKFCKDINHKSFSGAVEQFLEDATSLR